MSKYKAYSYDTPIQEIEKKYDIKLGVSPDMKLGDFLKQKGYESVAEILKEEKK